MTDGIIIEEQLKLSESLYHRVFEIATDGLLILEGIEGAILDVNPFLVSLSGYEKESLIGRQPWDLGLFHDPEAGKRMFDTLMETGRTQRCHIILKSNDGSLIESEAVASVFTEGAEKTVQYNFRTDGRPDEARGQPKSGEQHLPVQELTTADTTNTAIAHEFNNVLALILLSAEAITSSSEIKAKTALYASRIIEAVRRGMGLVKRLSHFPRSTKTPRNEGTL
jgi:PAS domain S-box-containing protein